MEFDKNKILIGILLFVSILFLSHIITTLLWIFFGEGWELDFLPNYNTYMKDALLWAVIRMIIMAIASVIIIAVLVWLRKREEP